MPCSEKLSCMKLFYFNWFFFFFRLLFYEGETTKIRISRQFHLSVFEWDKEMRVLWEIPSKHLCTSCNGYPLETASSDRIYFLGVFLGGWIKSKQVLPSSAFILIMPNTKYINAYRFNISKYIHSSGWVDCLFRPDDAI